MLAALDRSLPGPAQQTHTHSSLFDADSPPPPTPQPPPLHLGLPHRVGTTGVRFRGVHAPPPRRPASVNSATPSPPTPAPVTAVGALVPRAGPSLRKTAPAPPPPPPSPPPTDLSPPTPDNRARSHPIPLARVFSMAVTPPSHPPTLPRGTSVAAVMITKALGASSGHGPLVSPNCSEAQGGPKADLKEPLCRGPTRRVADRPRLCGRGPNPTQLPNLLLILIQNPVSRRTLFRGAL